MKLLINFAFLVFQTSSLVPETQDPILGQIRSAGAAEQLMNHMLKLVELLNCLELWGPMAAGWPARTSIFGGVCFHDHSHGKKNRSFCWSLFHMFPGNSEKPLKLVHVLFLGFMLVYWNVDRLSESQTPLARSFKHHSRTQPAGGNLLTLPQNHPKSTRNDLSTPINQTNGKKKHHMGKY